MSIHPIILQVLQENITWFSASSLSLLALKFALNLVMTVLVVQVAYRPGIKNKHYAFTYYVFNILIFFLCHLMTNVDLSIGFAFGLFALFSIMRYRTTTIGIKDMTFLFAVICIAVINSIYSFELSVFELVLINLLIVITVITLNHFLLRKQLHAQRVVYEKIHLIKTGQHEALLADLKERTGLPIVRYEVETINFLNDSAFIWVYFPNLSHSDSGNQSFIADTPIDVRKEQTNRNKLPTS